MFDSVTNNLTNSTGSLTRDSRTAPDFETLRTAFTEAMRFTMTSRTPQEERTLFETTDTVQKNVGEDRQKQNRREQDSKTQHRDFTKESKLALDKSEVRHSTIDDDYVRKIERQENIRTEYQEKAKHREFLSSNIISNTIRLDTPSFDTFSHGSISMPTPITIALESTVIESQATPLTPPDAPAIVPVSFRIANSQPIPMATESIPVVTMSLPSVGLSAPTSTMPIDVLTTTSVMTIFTVAGRFGQIKNENEERNSATEKKKEKKVTAPLFGQVVIETVQDYEKNVEQETEPESIDEQKHCIQKTFNENTGEPKDTTTGNISLKDMLKEEPSKEEPDEAVLELLRQMGNDFVQKKQRKELASKPFDRFQFFQRVLAACQSTANQNGTVRFKLNLDQFGSLTLKITSKFNRLSVKFETTTEAAARIILDNIDELKLLLAKQNVVLEQVDVCIESEPQP